MHSRGTYLFVSQTDCVERTTTVLVSLWRNRCRVSRYLDPTSKPTWERHAHARTRPPHFRLSSLGQHRQLQADCCWYNNSLHAYLRCLGQQQTWKSQEAVTTAAAAARSLFDPFWRHTTVIYGFGPILVWDAAAFAAYRPLFYTASIRTLLPWEYIWHVRWRWRLSHLDARLPGGSQMHTCTRLQIFLDSLFDIHTHRPPRT
jgi:hypothetical protein